MPRLDALFDLTGRSALVTGGNSGIGLAMARALGMQGACVHLAARDSARLDTACAELARDGISVQAHPANLADPEALQALSQSVGAVDILIDQSASTIAKSEVMKHAREDRSIPVGWALDAEGQPTTDPNVGLKGSMAPSGGYKGVGVALLVEVMAAALIDRLLHHCHIVNIRGSSYRMRKHTDLSKILHSPPADSSPSPPKRKRARATEKTTN